MYRNIKHIDGYNDQPSHISVVPYYFLDANVWVYCLAILNSIHDVDTQFHPYNLFFEHIINNNRYNGGNQKFIIEKNLLMEIINGYMRGPIREKYQYRREDYKDFRKTTYYTKHIKELIALFFSFENYFHPISPNFDIVKAKDFLLNFSDLNFCDVNDYYYHQICKNLNIPIVTNDSDFKFKDIKIITNNASLLRLKKKRNW